MIRVMSHEQTLNGDHVGIIDTDEGPMVFYLGPTQLFVAGDIGQQWYKNDVEYEETKEGIEKAIRAIIERKPTTSKDTTIVV
jgi:hypothetical protein